jgi:uncharacterized protein (DUF1810 family)
MADRFALDRFLEAQAGAYEAACDELRRGRKSGHWIWFIFPQLKDLGHSPTSQFYGLGSLEEARAYLAHPVLGPRLLDVTRLLLSGEGRDLRRVLGSPDHLKFRSCMTLFERAAPAPGLFAQALDEFCGGQRDERTLALLKRH